MFRGRIEWHCVLLTLLILVCLVTACGAIEPTPTLVEPAPSATQKSALQPVDLTILYTSNTRGVIHSTLGGGT